MPRPLVIDVTRSLPPRPTPLASEALSQVFGGCLAEFTNCTQNSQCCSYKCSRMWWIASQNRWEYQCFPPGTP
jgi:hypothetical protein